MAVEVEHTPGGCRLNEYLDWGNGKATHIGDILYSAKSRSNDS